MITDILPEPIEFEWDEGNVDKNVKKHGIENEEAESVFFDKNSVLAEDAKHSGHEKRYQIVGKSNVERLLNIIFTIRRQKVRIISARRMHPNERRLYENKKA